MKWLGIIGALMMAAVFTACSSAKDDIPAYTQEPVVSAQVTPVAAPSPAVSEAPEPISTPAPIEESEQAQIVVGGRRYSDYTKNFIPADDYGALLPYIGRCNPKAWSDDPGAYHYNPYFYGLMTTEGEVITDPVYSAIVRPGYFSGGDYITHNIFLLAKSGSIDMAAADGSWCIETDAARMAYDKNEIRLFSETAMSVYSAEGEMQAVYPYSDMGLDGEQLDILRQHIETADVGFTGERRGKYIALFQTGSGVLVFDADSGKATEIEEEEWMHLYEADAAASLSYRVIDGDTIFTQGENSFTIPHPVPDGGHASVMGSCVAFSDGAVYRMDGTELFPAESGCTVEVRTDSVYPADSIGGIIIRLTQNNVQCIRGDGREMLLPAEWNVREYFDAPDRNVRIVGEFLELTDARYVSYCDTDNGIVIAKFDLQSEALNK